MTVLTVGVTAILGKNIWNPRQKVLGAKAARNPLETLGRDLIKLGIKKTKFYQKPTTIAVIASKLDWCHFPAQMSKFFKRIKSKSLRSFPSFLFI